ncbi:MAG: Ig-like domain-containing protein, partial [Clostridia bacterium]|nr:Ig-like domain-containing protein [Clostridia bacterium]
MRKWMKNGAKLLMILSMLTAGVTLSACSFDFSNQNSESVSDTSSNVDSSSSYVPEILYEVKISINEWTMNVYEEVVLSAVATQDGEEIDSEIEWTSSDSTIATVVDGKVNALKTGTVTITASANGVLDTCVITVVNTAGDPQIMIDANEELQLRVGMTFQVAPTLVYNGSTYTDATFSFISGDSDVFTVSETGLITAVGEGDANLTVSASWRGLSGNDLTEVLRVKVIEDVAIALSNTETTTIYTTNKDFGNGQTYTNTVTYGATISLNGNVIDGSAVSTWNSSNTEVATIDPQTGVVTAVGVGETAITLSYVS